MQPSPLRKSIAACAAALLLWLGIRYLLPILLPFLLAALTAMAAEPAVRFLQAKGKLPRAAAAGIGVTLTLALLMMTLTAALAMLLRELGSVAGAVPDLEDTALRGMDSLHGFLADLAARTPDSVQPLLTRSVEELFSDGTEVIDSVAMRMLTLASGVVSRLPDGALGIGTWLLACFMISARLPKIRDWFARRLPRSRYGKYFALLGRLKTSVLGWLLAQCKLMGITFGVLCLGFFLLRISYAPLWAALISLVDALPILGTGTVLVPWSLVCFLQGDTVRAVGLLGVYAAAALLRSVLEPRLVGKELGLDPLVTLISMYAGYRLWGFGGLILSPLAAVTVTRLLIAPGEEPS